MVKLVDMPDLGSGAARRVGSSPITRTFSSNICLGFFYTLKRVGSPGASGLLPALLAQTFVWAFFFKIQPPSFARTGEAIKNLKSKVINLKSKSPSVSEGAFTFMLKDIYRLIIRSDFTFSPCVTITLYTPAG